VVVARQVHPEVRPVVARQVRRERSEPVVARPVAVAVVRPRPRRVERVAAVRQVHPEARQAVARPVRRERSELGVVRPGRPGLATVVGVERQVQGKPVVAAECPRPPLPVPAEVHLVRSEPAVRPERSEPVVARPARPEVRPEGRAAGSPQAAERRLRRIDPASSRRSSPPGR
jgi:hypothetical protein